LQARFSDAAWKVLAGAMISRHPETSFQMWQASRAQVFAGGFSRGYLELWDGSRVFDRVAPVVLAANRA
jgi:hypothetical protein